MLGCYAIFVLFFLHYSVSSRRQEVQTTTNDVTTSPSLSMYIFYIFILRISILLFSRVAPPLVPSAMRNACGDILPIGPGSSEPRKSCHQCKCSKLTGSLVVCTGMAPSGRPCRKGYCRNCLKRFYQDEELENDAASWKCFCCRDICSCTACRKQSSNCTLNPSKVRLRIHR